MDYCEWNNALASHFFDGDSDREVFLCVTSDTLAEVSKTSPESARADFINAIRNGPPWTDIPGCRRIASKAHNCFHPDPDWRNRSNRQTEVRTLTSHVPWREFADWRYDYPPYLAYLCLLVLSVTERNSVHGGQFYGPLNTLLGLDASDATDCADLRPSYEYNGKKISINDLWLDLEEWTFDHGTGVIYLPPRDTFRNSYEALPRVFGLLKTRDLKNIPRLFKYLEEAGYADYERLPEPEEFLERVCKLANLKSLLSADAAADLAIKDAQWRSAVGSLLLSRYRTWDGSVDEGEDGSPRECRSRLLRYLSRGTIRAVVKLRSISALRNLNLEQGRSYSVHSLQEPRLAWPGFESQWFDPLNVAQEAVFAGTSISSPELRLRAYMPPRSLIVMDNQQLPFHLRGGFLEVEEIHPGAAYTVLALGDEQPHLSSVSWTKSNGTLTPSGISAWRMVVPENVDRATWPKDIPPLARSQKDARHRISLESSCRVEPRRDIFLVGFPLRIMCRHADLEPFVTSQHNESVCLAECDGSWELTAAVPCRVQLALRKVGSCSAIEGTARDIEFLSSEDRIAPTYQLFPLFRPGSDKPPVYPRGKITTLGHGLLTTLRTGEQIHLGDMPPRVSFEATEGCELLMDGKPLCEKQISRGRGKRRLELVSYGATLDALDLRLVDTPKIHVSGLSRDKAKPTDFPKSLSAFVTCDDFSGLRIRYDIVGADGGFGEVLTPYPARIDPRSAGMQPGNIYEIRFSVGGLPACSCWCRWVPVHVSGHKQSRERRLSRKVSGFGQALDAALNGKGRA
jgi:hypothetical protein